MGNSREYKSKQVLSAGEGLLKLWKRAAMESIDRLLLNERDALVFESALFSQGIVSADDVKAVLDLVVSDYEDDGWGVRVSDPYTINTRRKGTLTAYTVEFERRFRLILSCDRCHGHGSGELDVCACHNVGNPEFVTCFCCPECRTDCLMENRS